MITKKLTFRENTRHEPCISHRKKTCQDIRNLKAIAEKYNCTSQLLNFGKHYEHDKNMPYCNESSMIESLKLYLDIEPECNISMSCLTETYTLTSKKHLNYSDETLVDFFLFPEVQYFNTYVSYDMLSFVSEIGGILGLTLGISGIACFDLVLEIIASFKNRCFKAL